MEILIDKSNTIKKSNELSAGKMIGGLTLNQAQLFAYAILVTQTDGRAEFKKSDFEKQFNLEHYNTRDAREDARGLIKLSIHTFYNHEDWAIRNVFTSISYRKGLFSFEWSEDFKPHILGLKERYTMIDLSIAGKFKSSFSWTLYEYLLAKYGYREIEISKQELMQLFSIDKVASYQKNTSMLKNRVLDVAINEINQHTELTVSYDDIKTGRAITGFNLNINRGGVVALATQKQTDYALDLLNKLKEDYIFRIIEIDDAEQATKANNLIMQTLREARGVDFGKLTHNKADELIKHINSIIKLLDKMIADDKDNTINKDKYASFEIPIYDWSND